MKKIFSLMLVLALIAVVCCGVLAEQQTYETEGIHRMGSDDSLNQARNAALREAKRLALEQAGTYLNSITQVVNGQVSKDEINSIASGVIKLDKIISEETKFDNGVTSVVIKACFIIDNDDLRKKIDDLQKSANRQEELKKIADLESKYNALLEKLNKLENQRAQNNDQNKDNQNKKKEQLPVIAGPDKAKVIIQNAPQVGSVIPFGGYNWRVLKTQDGKALLLSEKIIAKRKYHHSHTSITWAECDLRNYLNNDFYNSFSPADRARIVQTYISTNNNPWWRSVPGGSGTNDYIFLLSIEEVVKYFGDSGWLHKRLSANAWWWGISDQYNSVRIAADASGCSVASRAECLSIGKA
jgi:hypothetical protein